MKTIILSGIILFNVLLYSIAQEKFSIDPSKSTVLWLAQKVTGEHAGYVKVLSGSYVFNNNKIESGEVVVDMSSIVCTDIKDADMNAKLVGHLKSDDFFSVGKYPQATLVITESASFDKGSALVKANLTIRGVSHPVEFKATVQNKDGVQYFYANLVVDRTKYDIKYGSGKFFDNLGDFTIFDEFILKVTIASKKI